MSIDLTHADRALIERYLHSVLLRYKDERYNLLIATEELAQAFSQMARAEPAFRDHMRAVIEAADDA